MKPLLRTRSTSTPPQRVSLLCHTDVKTLTPHIRSSRTATASLQILLPSPIHGKCHVIDVLLYPDT